MYIIISNNYLLLFSKNVLQIIMNAGENRNELSWTKLFDIWSPGWHFLSLSINCKEESILFENFKHHNLCSMLFAKKKNINPKNPTEYVSSTNIYQILLCLQILKCSDLSPLVRQGGTLSLFLWGSPSKTWISTSIHYF